MGAQLVVELSLDLVASKDRARAIAQLTPEFAEHASPHVEDEGYGGRQSLPCVSFGVELFPAGSRELVELGATVVVRRAPLGFDPAASLEAVEGGVEGPLRDLQCRARHLVNSLGDRPTVLRSER